MEISKELIRQAYSNESRANTSAEYDLRARYPTLSDFVKVFGAERQLPAMGNPATFILDSTAPKLGAVASAYGAGQAKAWMINHLITVFNVTRMGNDENDVDALITEIADILLEKFRWEKVTVFILFCAKCRAHDYKISYGTVKVDAILEAAGKFLGEYLPIAKEKAGYQQQTEMRDINIKECNGWKHCTQRSLFEAWRDGTLRLIKEKGLKAIGDSVRSDDAYHLGIAALVGIGALDINTGKFNEQIFENHVSTLRQ